LIYLWSQRAFWLNLILFFGFSLMLLFGLKKFQILFSVLLISFRNESLLFQRYYFGVFTFPSTTTTPLSTSDWEVFVPLMGAFSLPKPFLLNKFGKIPYIRSKAGFRGIFCFGASCSERSRILIMHILNK
jgi:hypothetical protein